MDAGQTRLTLEELDARVLPGSVTFRILTGPTEGVTETSPIAYSPPVYHGYRIFANNPLLVEGSASGTYTKTVASTSVSASYAISGSIDLFGFGNLNLSGTIHAVGVNQAQADGQLFLTTTTGTITLGLTGPAHGSKGTIPSELIFTVTSATGEYSHAGGQGVIQLAESPTSSTTGHISMSLT
jgi:hypothetical protein